MNWEKLMVKAYAISAPKPTAGRLTKKTAGKATRENRSPPSNKGGTSFNPTLIMTKFTPQITTTSNAASQSFKGIVDPARLFPI
jgi:hypothetical protein